MNRTPARSQVFSLTYTYVSVESLLDLKCRACKAFLDTHQPDPSQPERILGTCPQCGVWMLIESTGDDSKLMVLELPDLAIIPHLGVSSSKS